MEKEEEEKRVPFAENRHKNTAFTAQDPATAVERSSGDPCKTAASMSSSAPTRRGKRKAAAAAPSTQPRGRVAKSVGLESVWTPE